MQWILRNSYDLCEVSDSFMVGRFYLRLGGNTLSVEAEEENDDEVLSAARALAEQYITILRKHIPGPTGLMTFEEYASMSLPESITIRGATPVEHKRLRNGVRQARHELLAAGDPWLRRCYDYMDQAHEDEHNCLFHLYKFVETLEEAFGGEAKLISALNVKKAVKGLKALANDKTYDDTRHAPKVGNEVKRLSPEDRSHAMDWAYEILAVYERHIRSRTTHK